MKRCGRALMGVLFCGLVLIIGMFLFMDNVSAYTKTNYELRDNWYGNKIEVASIVTVSPNGVKLKAGQVFRCGENIVVSSVYLYVGARQGTWTGTERLMIGLQGVNLTTGYNNDVWLGATGDGKNIFYPATTGWLKITLNETVSLTAGTMYSLVLYDYKGLCTNTKYLALVANSNPLDYVNTNTLYGYYEEFDCYFQRLASGNNRFGTMVYMISDGATYQGFPYLSVIGTGLASTTITDIYAGNCTRQFFNVSENITVDEVSVYMSRKLASTIPTASVSYEIRLQSGSVLRSGVLAVPLESCYLSGVRWQTASFSSLGLFTNGSYELRLWSNCALASSWEAVGLQTVATFTYNQSTYQGNTSCFSASENNGSTWTIYKGIDLQYKFRKVPLITITNSLTNVTGSSTSSWNGTGYTISNTFSSPLVWFMNLVNAHGTHTSVWTGTQNNLFVNITGNASTGVTSEPLIIHNPNPANGTNGGYNIMQQNSAGIDCSVDVQYQNMTELSEANLGTGILYENCTNTTTVVGFNVFTIYQIGQSFKVNQSSFVLHNISLYSKKVTVPSTVYINLYEVDNYTGTGFPTSPAISTGSKLGTEFSAGYDWNNITMSPCVLYNGSKYMFIISSPATDGSPERIILLAHSPVACSPENDSIEGQLIQYDGIIWGTGKTCTDALFGLWGWSLGGNITWDHVINLTYYNITNTPFGFQYAVQNTTYGVLNANYSFNSTQYQWYVIGNNSVSLEKVNTSILSFIVGSLLPTVTVNENNVNVTGGYTTIYNPLSGWIVNNTYTGVTTPLHQLENIINATGTHTYLLNGTGYWDWANYTGNASAPTPITLHEDITEAIGSHEYALNSTGYHVWANYTGWSSALNIIENFINATGYHDYNYDTVTGWNVYANVTGNTTNVTLHESLVNTTGAHIKILRGIGGWDVYANYTGTATTTFIGENLSLINPNPGDGTHITEATGFGVGGNYLRSDSDGLTTSIDVTYINFTTPPAIFPGDYSLSFIGSQASNGMNIQNNSLVYLDAYENNTGQVIPGPLSPGQFENAGEYWIVRSFLLFDTSALPDEAVINSAYVRLVVYEDDYTDVDFNISIQQSKPPCPHDPIMPGDYDRHYFPSSATFGTRNVSGFVDDDWFNISINASGIADINLSGFTKWVLRSEQDILADAPGVGVDEWIQFYAPSGVTPQFNPYLIINYTVPSSNWGHIVNITWYSNSSGAWLPYAWSYENSNGTVTVPAVNFSAVENYYWNVSWNSNGGNHGDSNIWFFETVSSLTHVIPLEAGFSGYNMMFVLFSLMAMCVAILGARRRKRKQRII